LSEGCVVGPYARLRPGTVLGPKVRIGNFVETKKAVVGQGSKINHLSYVGDASVGQHVNIGAGTITCNYDGYNKHQTVIGDGVFIGSDTLLVAPIHVGQGSYTGSGSVLSDDVPADSLALTRPARQIFEGWADRFRSKQAKE
jgi:N-acetylglucosamine-1-phosphate uridyltransferase (contains nucleotidyltransferase and I-patch acetyltransferase domains)